MGAIFISHSSRNNAQATELARLLREKKYRSLFLDFHPDEGIPAGRSWERTLYQSLRACQAVIAICTDDYLKSHWCFAEIALARMERKDIFALKMDPLTLPLPSILEEKQFIDMRDPATLDEGYRRLWNGLDEIGLARVKGDWSEPYRGLSAFDEQHAPIFFGREEETRAGLRLLERGAPGLIMVNGTSGSGKSSLVRAGMIPQLRLDPRRWIVLEPLQPGRAPFRELATSLAHAFRRYAPDDVAGASWERIAQLLERAGRACLADSGDTGGVPGTENRADGPAYHDGAQQARDERLAALLEQLGTLSRTPPEGAGPEMRTFLEWTLSDLQRICGLSAASSVAGEEPGPAATPLVELAERLRRGSEETRHATVLVVIDQFEELLGRETADEADAFLTLMRRSVETASGPIVVLGTMRTDFMAAFQRHPVLRGIQSESLPIGPMGPDGMLRVIRRPAELAHIELEDGLAELLLEHTGTPDALPLLSFTLWKLWKDCGSDNKLDIEEYRALGELKGAIAHEAEELLSGISRSELAILREAFVLMARPADDGGYARKPVSWSELPDGARPLLERFVEKRLLMTRGEDEVEVAHEALFRSWQQLSIWLDDYRAEMMLADQLGRDAQLWSERAEGRAKEDLLWRGGRLQQAAELLARQDRRAPGRKPGRAAASVAARFVNAGLAARRRQRRLLVGGVVGTIAVLLLFSGVSWKLKLDANEQATLARANLMAFQAGELLESDHTRALALARDAYALVEHAPPAAVQKVLSDAFHKLHETHEAANGGGRHIYHTELPHDPAAGGVNSIDVAAEASRVVIATNDGRMSFRDFDRAGKRVEFQPVGDLPVYSAVLSDDGTHILAAYEDGVARLWNIASRGEVGRYPRQPAPADAAMAPIDLALFQPKTDRILTGCTGNSGAGCADAAVRLWDDNGDLVATLPTDSFPGHRAAGDTLLTAEFSPDGYILTAWMGGTAMLWDDSGEFVAEFAPAGAAQPGPPSLNAARLSPDGRRVLLARSSAPGIEVWSEQEGKMALGPVLEHPDAERIAFSPDGRMLTVDIDGTIKLWSAAANSPPLSLPLGDRTACADLSWDGWLLACTYDKPTVVQVWRNDTHVANLDHGGEPIDSLRVRFSADGRQIVSVDIHGTLRFWDIPQRVAAMRVARDSAFSADFAAQLADSGTVSGSPLLTTHSDGVRFHDPSSATTTLLNHEDARSASVSHDGRYVVTRSRDYSLKLWAREARGGLRFAATQPFPRVAYLLARFSPATDSLLTLASASDGTALSATLWQLPEGDRLPPLPGKTVTLDPERPPDRVAARFSPDGQRIAITTRDGHCWLWSVDHENDPVTCRATAADRIVAAAFADSSEPVLLVTDGSGLRPDYPTARAGAPRMLEAGSGVGVRSFALAPGARGLLLVATEDGHVRLWNPQGELVADFDHAGQAVNDASFSPEGQRVVSASLDGVRLWLSPAAVYEVLRNTRNPPGPGTSSSR